MAKLELQRLRLCPSGLNMERKGPKWRQAAEQHLQCLEEMKHLQNGTRSGSTLVQGQAYHDEVQHSSCSCGQSSIRILNSNDVHWQGREDAMREEAISAVAEARDEGRA